MTVAEVLKEIEERRNRRNQWQREYIELFTCDIAKKRLSGWNVFFSVSGNTF